MLTHILLIYHCFLYAAVKSHYSFFSNFDTGHSISEYVCIPENIAGSAHWFFFNFILKRNNGVHMYLMVTQTWFDLPGKISIIFNNEYIIKGTNDRVTSIAPNVDKLGITSPNLSWKSCCHIWRQYDDSWLIWRNSNLNQLIFNNQSPHNLN